MKECCWVLDKNFMYWIVKVGLRCGGLLLINWKNVDECVVISVFGVVVKVLLNYWILWL